MLKLLCSCFLIFWTLGNATGTPSMDCPSVVTQRLNSNRTTLKFKSDLHQEDVGFSVELFFSGPISDLQAIYWTNQEPKLTRISDRHWIVSVEKVQKLEVRMAEFEANFTDGGKAVLNGVILNGKETLCGSGDSSVYVPRDRSLDGRQECELEEKRYEQETTMTFERDFYSPKIGLAIDIIFQTDVDLLHEVPILYPTKHSSRHYSLLNSGYMTSKNKPVKFTFNIHHRGRPTPKVSAIVMNDITICGFSPSFHVSPAKSLESFSSLLELEYSHLATVENLNLCCTIISACGLLVAIVTSAFAWKLTAPSDEVYTEPTYAVPQPR